jgi:hypothetical protein
MGNEEITPQNDNPRPISPEVAHAVQVAARDAAGRLLDANSRPIEGDVLEGYVEAEHPAYDASNTDPAILKEARNDPELIDLIERRELNVMRAADAGGFSALSPQDQLAVDEKRVSLNYKIQNRKAKLGIPED